jgi:hypothetical protein
MVKILHNISRGVLLYVAVFFLFGVILSGCVPSPEENTPIIITNLSSYFIPQSSNRQYLWQHIEGSKDSLYFQYMQKTSLKTWEGYSPVWKIITSDTLYRDSTVIGAYISDSLIKLFFGKDLGRADDSTTPRQIYLLDTLHVGAKWTVAENFATLNGVSVQIIAQVIDYYGQASAGNSIVSDVFVISYTSVVKGSGEPIESEFQNGSHVDRYFGKDIGVFREICKDFRNSIIWTKQLLETRAR